MKKRLQAGAYWRGAEKLGRGYTVLPAKYAQTPESIYLHLDLFKEIHILGLLP